MRAATTTPTRYLKRPDLGGVAVGKRADLVLLTANPLDDIGNTAKIEAVVERGRMRDRAALDALLVEAERMTAGTGERG